MARKTTKICPVCGNEFKGTEGKITCSNACRTAVSRMLKKGKKPEYWLMAKGKGQKMPLALSGPLPKKIKKATTNNQEYQTKSEHDTIIAPKTETIAIEEEVLPPLTWEQKWAHNDEINRRINEEKNKPLPPRMHPRQFRLQQDDIIAELEKQKIKIN